MPLCSFDSDLDDKYNVVSSIVLSDEFATRDDFFLYHVDSFLRVSVADTWINRSGRYREEAGGDDSKNEKK